MPKKKFEGQEWTVRDYIEEALQGVMSDENSVEIIEKVIQNAEISFPINREFYVFKYGRKELILDIYLGDFTVTTEVSNVVDPEFRQTNETTICYLAAKTILQMTADKLGQPLQYTFYTLYSKLNDWVDAKNLFEWQSQDTQLSNYNYSSNDSPEWNKMIVVFKPHEKAK